MRQHSSNGLADQIARVLSDDGIAASFDRDLNVISFPMHIKGTLRYIRCAVTVYDKFYVLTSRLPISVPSHDAGVRSRMCEFVSRVNCNLKYGSFDLDLDSGKIQYRLCVSTGTQLAMAKAIRSCLTVSLSTIRIYSSGFVRVRYDGMGSKRAVEECIDQMKKLLGSSGEMQFEQRSSDFNPNDPGFGPEEKADSDEDFDIDWDEILDGDDEFDVDWDDIPDSNDGDCDPEDAFIPSEDSLFDGADD